MPQSLLTGQLKEKPTYRVWCLSKQIHLYWGAHVCFYQEKSRALISTDLFSGNVVYSRPSAEKNLQLCSFVHKGNISKVRHNPQLLHSRCLWRIQRHAAKKDLHQICSDSSDGRDITRKCFASMNTSCEYLHLQKRTSTSLCLFRLLCFAALSAFIWLRAAASSVFCLKVTILRWGRCSYSNIEEERDLGVGERWD